MFSQLRTFCVTICLLLNGGNCIDEWETINTDVEIEAPCTFDNDDAGRTCNCGFRNEVPITLGSEPEHNDCIPIFSIEDVSASYGW